MTQPTEKLYINDSLTLAFRAKILGKSQWQNQPSLLLDRSAFYPEGGGQPGDHGHLVCNGKKVEVVDVQIDAEGLVHHLTDHPTEEGFEQGEVIDGEVEGHRRRDYMSQHTGQHMLSAMIEKTMDMPTMSARLGSKSGTIDVKGDPEKFTKTQLQAIEDAINVLVLKDLPIDILYPTPEALVDLGLRRAPKVSENIRIIKVGDFDCTPCGGTHCQRTGQVGPVKIMGTERYKGLTRLSFLAGKRTLDYLSRQDSILSDLTNLVGCAPEELQSHFTRQRDELKRANQELGVFRAQAIRHEAANLIEQWAGDHRPRILVREAEDLKASRQLAAALIQNANTLILIASREDDQQDWRLILTRSDDHDFDCGAWFRNQGKSAGARGGGRPNRAEGSLPGDMDPNALVLL